METEEAMRNFKCFDNPIHALSKVFKPLDKGFDLSIGSYRNFSYSDLACFRMEMPTSASFQMAKKS